ncbi:MAG: TRAP transporter small permease [Thiohalomonadaceae bacterium]|jgi:TRAP-type C4-dicarboxylate transport system permease small subunit
MRIKDYLEHINNALRRFEDGLIVLMVLSMVLLAAGQIVLRNVFGGGLVWVDPFLRVMVLWLGLLGAMVATRHNNHITVDVLSRFLSAKIKYFIRIITGLFASVICAILAWHGARFMLAEYTAATEVFTGVPTWCCVLIIPVGFVVMSVRFFVHTFKPGAVQT